ncbi:MAG: hypothetical protein CMC08_06860 [Flavobacteriaceae bacterium]|nr:hypothetical protein [Flavobacteriaceae bacterium]
MLKAARFLKRAITRRLHKPEAEKRDTHGNNAPFEKAVWNFEERDDDETIQSNSEESDGASPETITSASPAAEFKRLETEPFAPDLPKDLIAEDDPADIRAEVAHHGNTTDKVPSGREKAISHTSALDASDVIRLLRGDLAVVENLIETARLDAVDSKGCSALHVAAGRGDVAMCHALVRAGADRHRRNNVGQTAREIAERKGHLTTLHLFRQLEAERSRSDSVLPRYGMNEAPSPIDWLSQEEQPQPEPDGGERESQEPYTQLDPIEGDTLDLEFSVEFETDADDEDFTSGVESSEWSGEISEFQEGTQLGNETSEAESEDWLDGLTSRAVIEPDGSKQNDEPVPEALRALRSFAEVRQRGRRPEVEIRGPVCRGWYLAEVELKEWCERMSAQGYCTADDVADLIGRIEGDFRADELARTLETNFQEEGLWGEDSGIWDVGWNGEVDDISDLLRSACNGSNIRPGVEQENLTKRREKQLVWQIASTRKEALKVLARDQAMLRAVNHIGELVLKGTFPVSEMTNLFRNPFHDLVEVEPFREALASLKCATERNDEAADLLERLGLTLVFLASVPGLANGAAPELVFHFQEALHRHRQAREEMLIANLPMLRRFAARRMRDRVRMEDAFQDGFFGLDRSLDGFDASRGYRFMTYSQFWMRQTIDRAVQDFGGDIRLPVHFQERLKKIDKFIAAFEAEHGRIPEIHEFPEIDELTSEEIEKALSTPRFPVTFKPEIVDEFWIVENDEARFATWYELRPVLDEMLDGLPDRQKDILTRRFGLDGGDEMTLEEIGQIYGVTRERIRQIEAKALDTLRHPAKAKVLREFL